MKQMRPLQQGSREKLLFVERHAEGSYKTKHAKTRLGSTILPYTYTYTHTQIHTYRQIDETKEGRKED